MYTITKQFSFSASHVLDHLPEGHPCARLHGHNYVVELVLRSGDLNGDGFVRDYNELAIFKNFVDEKLDHRHLDDVIDGPPQLRTGLVFCTSSPKEGGRRWWRCA
jgi:6-pyruvoyltetrahydropterin/6-carboxytetrahydropterin synthase